MIGEPRQEAFEQATVGDDVLSLGALIEVFWKWLWVIVLVVVVLTGTVVGVSLSQTPQYEASIEILIGQARGIGETPQDSAVLQDLTPTMAELVYSRRVAEVVIQQLGLETTPSDFLANASAEPMPDTQVIQVSYRDPDPERARLVADTIGEVFSEQVAQISPDASNLTATVWEQAVVPSEPVSPNPVQNGFLALVLGGMLGMGLAFLLEYFDDRWGSPEEAEQVSGFPTYGVIPEFEAPKDKGKWKKQEEGKYPEDES